MELKIDPNKYWKERGKTYYRNFKFNDELIRYQEEQVIGYLKNNISPNEIRTVLEIGCGFGRYTKLILDIFPHIEQYRAIELSLDQLEYAKKYMDDNRVCYMEKSIQDYQDNQKYDLLFAGEILFQIPPIDIESVMYKVLSLTETHLIHIDPKQQYKRDRLYFFDKNQNVVEFAFFHDYDNIIRNLNINSKSQKYVLLSKIYQAIYHVVMK